MTFFSRRAFHLSPPPQSAPGEPNTHRITTPQLRDCLERDFLIQKRVAFYPMKLFSVLLVILITIAAAFAADAIKSFSPLTPPPCSWTHPQRPTFFNTT